MFKLEFETGSDAFFIEGGPPFHYPWPEIERILKEISNGFVGVVAGSVYDSNGNRIGKWSLTDD